MDQSVFGYGLPVRVRELIDLPIADEATYTDLLCAFAGLLSSPVKYLELGVSVGKNLAQLLEYVQGAEVVGFDIENLNPALLHWLEPQGEERRWATRSGSLRLQDSTIERYRVVTNPTASLTYLAGDILDSRSWQHLQGRRFNLVFSDALHEPEAISKELAHLCAENLLDLDIGAIVWDDLQNPAMFHAIRAMRTALESHLGRPLSAFGFCQLRGWLGQHEQRHVIGIATWDRHGELRLPKRFARLK